MDDVASMMGHGGGGDKGKGELAEEHAMREEGEEGGKELEGGRGRGREGEGGRGKERRGKERRSAREGRISCVGEGATGEKRSRSVREAFETRE
jgi:hypothetical protein